MFRMMTATEANPLNAINWALEQPNVGMQLEDFLRDWNEGNLSDYPTYVDYCAKLDADTQANDNSLRRLILKVDDVIRHPEQVDMIVAACRKEGYKIDRLTAHSAWQRLSHDYGCNWLTISGSRQNHIWDSIRPYVTILLED